jgi:hypothetical protein
VQYLRFGLHDAANCPTSTCGTTTLNIGEVQLFTNTDPADLINSTTTTATSDSVFTDAGSVQHPETLSIDDTLGTWFGSNSQNNASWLELDLGSYAPYYADMYNVTM